jgi:glutaredoxin
VLIARILILSLACTTFFASAQIMYLGKDAAGNATLTKEPPPGFEPLSSPLRPQAPKSSGGSVQSKSGVRPPSSASAKVLAAASPGELVLYTAAWCPYCKAARQYFSSNRIAYREIDIESPEGSYSFANAGGGKGIPLLIDGDRKASGFSASYYDWFLKGRPTN